jgi:hypothetical protein
MLKKYKKVMDSYVEASLKYSRIQINQINELNSFLEAWKTTRLTFIERYLKGGLTKTQLNKLLAKQNAIVLRRGKKLSRIRKSFFNKRAKHTNQVLNLEAKIIGGK